MALTSPGLLTLASSVEIAREFATESASKTSKTLSTNCSNFEIAKV
jgi:hypothetical protein